jgi:hypothetical protein
VQLRAQLPLRGEVPQVLREKAPGRRGQLLARLGGSTAKPGMMMMMMLMLMMMMMMMNGLIYIVV